MHRKILKQYYRMWDGFHSCPLYAIIRNEWDRAKYLEKMVSDQLDDLGTVF